jgi:hypothetical protein
MPWLATAVAPVRGGAGCLKARSEDRNPPRGAWALILNRTKTPIQTGGNTGTFCLTYRMSPDGPLRRGHGW